MRKKLSFRGKTDYRHQNRNPQNHSANLGTDPIFLGTDPKKIVDSIKNIQLLLQLASFKGFSNPKADIDITGISGIIEFTITDPM